MVFPVLVMREHSPATFVWVLFWDLTRVYLFENKICDSDMILMCLLFYFGIQIGFKNNYCSGRFIYFFTFLSEKYKWIGA